MTRYRNGFIAGRQLLLLILATVFLSACAGSMPTVKSRPVVLVRESVAHKPQEAAQTLEEEKAVAESPKADGKVAGGFTLLEPLKFDGSRKITGITKSLPFSRERMVTVAVDRMPLPAFIHHVFSEILQVNYVMETGVESLTETVTLSLPDPVSEEQLFQIAGEVLGKNKLSVYEKDGIFYISTEKTKTDYLLGIGPFVSDIPGTTGLVRQIIPVRYAEADSLAFLIPPSAGLEIRPAINENFLIATGPREGIERVIRFVDMLDRPAMRGRHVGMIDVKYWILSDFVEKLSEPLAREGIPVAKSGNVKGLYFIPMETLGRVLVFSAEKAWLDRAVYWAGILDVPAVRAQKEYFLFYPRNSRALDLGKALQSILSLAGPEGIMKKESPVKTPQGQRAEAQSGEESLVITQGDIRMAVDENRNALIIYAAADRYHEIERLLRKLDVIPEQVLIEATIAEVTLTGSFELGVEWALRNYTPDKTGETGIYNLIAGGGGLNWALLSTEAKFESALKALAQDSRVKILSSPNITVRDGKSASIVVGRDVPVLTQEATSDIQVEGTSAIIRSVQYRRTGVDLSVTPVVHAQGVVTLEIAQSVTQAEKTTTSDIDSPTILNRSINTEVVVGNGQTVVLGGLISESGSEGESGVPFLKDIPILGYLFKSATRSSDRTELIIMITPQIIRSAWQIDEIRDAVFRGLELIGPEERERGVEKPENPE